MSHNSILSENTVVLVDDETQPTSWLQYILVCCVIFLSLYDCRASVQNAEGRWRLFLFQLGRPKLSHLP